MQPTILRNPNFLEPTCLANPGGTLHESPAETALSVHGPVLRRTRRAKRPKRRQPDIHPTPETAQVGPKGPGILAIVMAMTLLTSESHGISKDEDLEHWTATHFPGIPPWGCVRSSWRKHTRPSSALAWNTDLDPMRFTDLFDAYPVFICFAMFSCLVFDRSQKSEMATAVVFCDLRLAHGIPTVQRRAAGSSWVSYSMRWSHRGRSPNPRCCWLGNGQSPWPANAWSLWHEMTSWEVAPFEIR